jgi:signal transduction histidine kinase
MSRKFLRSGGLRTRLLVTFGMLAFVFSAFTATVFLNVERTILEAERRRAEQAAPAGGHAAARQPAVEAAQAEARILGATARFFVLYLALNGLLFLIVGAAWLTREVVRPVTRLADAMARVETAGAGYRGLAVDRDDELGDLTRSFNELMARIETSEAKNADYVRKLEAAYADLERAQERLLTQEKLASLGRLSAGIAHEIGNPLSAITGYLGLIEGADEPDRADSIARALAEARRIDRIIRGLLAFARPGTGEPTPQAPAPFVEGVVAGLRVQPLCKHIEITLTAEPELPVIDTGGGRLEQVLMNLCVNAADAMGGQGRIGVTLAKAAGGVRITVEDTGPGIPPAELGRVFEPFYTTKPSDKGTGLGLAISHQIVTALRGALWAENAPAGGARFVIELPAHAGMI